MRVVLVLTFCGLFLSGCLKPFQQPEKIVISVGTTILSALVYVAEDRGYFKEEGLAVSLQPTPTGTEALKTVVEEKADLATCTETPVMLTIMDGKKIYILSTIADSEIADVIVARRDRGISKPQDLQGKTIGVPPLVNVQYFFDTFLLDNGIPRTKTKVVQIKTDELNETLLRGKVDAVCVWEPLQSELMEKLGANGQVFSGVGSYRSTWQLVAMQDFVKKHPDTVKKVLRALIKAKGFVIEHPETALQITANYLHVDKSTLETSWKGNNYKVTLSQAVLISLQDQARWVVQKESKDKKAIPDFLDSFYLEGLKSIDPTLVSVGD